MAEPLADLSDPLLCQISKLDELNSIIEADSINSMVDSKVSTQSALKNRIRH